MDNIAIGSEAYEHIGNWKIGRLGDLIEIDCYNYSVACYCFESSVSNRGNGRWQSQGQSIL
jgi:hypothetical protein